MTSATASEARDARRAAPSQRPPLSVVARRRRSLRILSVIAIVLVLVVIFGSVAFQAMIVQNQSAIDDVDARIALLEERRQDLLVEQAELKDPERLSAYATDRLGMVEPEQSSVVVLEPVSPTELGQPHSAGPDSPDADSAGPDSPDADSAGPDSADADSAGPDSADADSAGPDSADADSAGPDSADADSAGPDSADADGLDVDGGQAP